MLVQQRGRRRFSSHVFLPGTKLALFRLTPARRRRTLKPLLRGGRRRIERLLLSAFYEFLHSPLLRAVAGPAALPCRQNTPTTFLHGVPSPTAGKKNGGLEKDRSSRRGLDWGVSLLSVPLVSQGRVSWAFSQVHLETLEANLSVRDISTAVPCHESGQPRLHDGMADGRSLLSCFSKKEASEEPCCSLACQVTTRERQMEKRNRRGGSSGCVGGRGREDGQKDEKEKKRHAWLFRATDFTMIGLLAVRVFCWREWRALFLSLSTFLSASTPPCCSRTFLIKGPAFFYSQLLFSLECLPFVTVYLSIYLSSTMQSTD